MIEPSYKSVTNAVECCRSSVNFSVGENPSRAGGRTYSVRDVARALFVVSANQLPPSLCRNSLLAFRFG